MSTQPLQFLLLLFAGWVNRQQLYVIEYLKIENKILREQLGGKRIHLTDNQRRRLAVKAKVLGRNLLSELTSIARPDTILRWYRKLVANKYDGSKKRSPGRPRTKHETRALVARMAVDNPRWGYTRIRGALSTLE